MQYPCNDLRADTGESVHPAANRRVLIILLDEDLRGRGKVVSVGDTFGIGAGMATAGAVCCSLHSRPFGMP